MALRHPPPASSLDASFLSRVASLKLHDLRLSVRPLPFTASFSLPHRIPQGTAPSPSLPSQERLVVAADALDLDASAIKRAVLTTGEVSVFNTIESFKELDKKQFLQNIAADMCRQIDSGEVEDNPSLLVRCDLIVFSDLKDYKHYYWFAFPALCFPDPPTLSDSILSLEDTMSAQMIHQLHVGYNGLLESSGNGIPPFFLVVLDKEADSLAVKPLRDYPSCDQDGREIWFGFVDHSPLQSNPGWSLRKPRLLRSLYFDSWVSYSNPTRQWLFEFEDCVDPENRNEGRPKAKVPLILHTSSSSPPRLLLEFSSVFSPPPRPLHPSVCFVRLPPHQTMQAAADRLSRIVPNMEAEGIELTIPMPGHPVAEELQGKVLGDVAKLADLIQHADLIFLLTDTRESRWLPTLLCAAKSKVSPWLCWAHVLSSRLAALHQCCTRLRHVRRDATWRSRPRERN
eukprot:768744-Hanusia_phi.AAC.5